MHARLELPVSATVLVMVDLQEEHRQDPRYLVEGFDAVLDKAAQLVGAARRAGMPVFHAAYVRDFGVVPPRPLEPTGEGGAPLFSERGEGTEICVEVAPDEGEAVFEKNDASCFSDPIFCAAIDDAGPDWMIVAGVWTEACVTRTVQDAVARGIRVALVKDACGSGTEAMHQSAVLHLANRMYGGAVIATTDAVDLIGGEARDVWQLTTSTPLRFDAGTLSETYNSL